MGFICSSGAATIKLQCEMEWGNITGSAGASLSSRGNTRRRFPPSPRQGWPVLLWGSSSSSVLCQWGWLHAQGRFQCSAAVAGRSGIVARFPLTSARLEEQEDEAVI